LAQTNDLLEKIEKIDDLEKNHLTGASVILYWIARRVQPLQKYEDFGFMYKGRKDPSRFTSERITESELCVEYSRECMESQFSRENFA
jgi:hypothetical protein